MRIRFVVGQSVNATLQGILQQESDRYGDIIQSDALASPSANAATLTTLAGLVWAYRYCPSVDLILKCDDDVFVNPSKLIHMMDDSKAGPASVVGRIVSRMNPHNTTGSIAKYLNYIENLCNFFYLIFIHSFVWRLLNLIFSKINLN